jgi:hypothetical protein
MAEQEMTPATEEEEFIEELSDEALDRTEGAKSCLFVVCVNCNSACR